MPYLKKQVRGTRTFQKEKMCDQYWGGGGEDRGHSLEFFPAGIAKTALDRQFSHLIRILIFHRWAKVGYFGSCSLACFAHRWKHLQITYVRHLNILTCYMLAYHRGNPNEGDLIATHDFYNYHDHQLLIYFMVKVLYRRYPHVVCKL